MQRLKIGKAHECELEAARIVAPLGAVEALGIVLGRLDARPSKLLDAKLVVGVIAYGGSR